jgi:hypothetical protein
MHHRSADEHATDPILNFITTINELIDNAIAALRRNGSTGAIRVYFIFDEDEILEYIVVTDEGDSMDGQQLKEPLISFLSVEDRTKKAAGTDDSGNSGSSSSSNSTKSSEKTNKVFHTFANGDLDKFGVGLKVAIQVYGK